MEEFVSLLYPFWFDHSQQRSALCSDLDQGSDSDAQKTIKYDFNLFERNCLVQKLPQKTDVTFVRLDNLNLDKYVELTIILGMRAVRCDQESSHRSQAHDQPQQK